MSRLREAVRLCWFCESWGALLQRLFVCELQAAESARQEQEAQLQQLDHQIADLDGQLAQQGASQPTGEAVSQELEATDRMTAIQAQPKMTAPTVWCILPGSQLATCRGRMSFGRHCAVLGPAWMQAYRLPFPSRAVAASPFGVSQLGSVHHRVSVSSMHKDLTRRAA